MKVEIDYDEDLGLENEIYESVKDVLSFEDTLKIKFYMSEELEDQDIVTTIEIHKSIIKSYKVSYF